MTSDFYLLNSESCQPLDPDYPFNPFNPLNPRRRRPMPKRPFEAHLEWPSEGNIQNELERR